MEYIIIYYDVDLFEKLPLDPSTVAYKFKIKLDGFGNIKVNGRYFFFPKRYEELDKLGREYFQLQCASLKDITLLQNDKFVKNLIINSYLDSVFDEYFPLLLQRKVNSKSLEGDSTLEEKVINPQIYEDINFIGLTHAVVSELSLFGKMSTKFPSKGVELCRYQCRVLGSEITCDLLDDSTNPLKIFWPSPSTNDGKRATNKKFTENNLYIVGDHNSSKGKFCTVEGNGTHGFGKYSKYFGDDVVVHGDQCKVVGDNAIIFGNKCKVFGNNFKIYGKDCQVYNRGSLIDFDYGLM